MLTRPPPKQSRLPDHVDCWPSFSLTQMNMRRQRPQLSSRRGTAGATSGSKGWLQGLVVLLVLLVLGGCAIVQVFGSTGLDSTTLSSLQEYASVNPWQSAPTQSSTQSSSASPRILVVYGAPTSLLPRDANITYEKTTWNALGGMRAMKTYQYELNTEYFIKHGIQCKTQDTMLVVTNLTSAFYKERTAELDVECRKHGHRVYVIERDNKCLDLEAVRVAVYEGPVNVSTYDYFFYINCGVSGPAKEVATLPWTQLFIDKLRDGVKMTGLSHNCGPPHIQSMMYALDREGLQLLRDKGTIFDCHVKIANYTKLKKNVAHGQIVNAYERKMGQYMLGAGFGIDPYMRSRPLFQPDQRTCNDTDIWLGSRLKALGGGRIPFLNETIFFKSTRYMSPELVEEIGFKAKVQMNWE